MQLFNAREASNQIELDRIEKEKDRQFQRDGQLL
jgi:hypothetical protein